MPITVYKKCEYQYVSEENRWSSHAETLISTIVKDWLDSGKATSVVLFFRSKDKDLDAYFPIMSNNPNGLKAKNFESADKKSKIIGIDPIEMEIELSNNGNLSERNIALIYHKAQQKTPINNNMAFMILDNIYTGSIIIIESIKELSKLYEKFNNLEYIRNKQYILTGPLVRFKFNGKAYDSSLAGSCFIGLADFQKKLKKLLN